MTKHHPGQSKFTVLIDETLAYRLSRPFSYGEKGRFFRELLECLALLFEHGWHGHCMSWLFHDKPLVIPSIKDIRDGKITPDAQD